MPVYEFGGLRPVVHPSAFLHPTAVLIGDVVIGARCYIGPNASLRGDFGRLEMHDGANIQDNGTFHSFPGRAAVVAADGHIGHGAVLHGCQIGRNALIGMNAVIMDNAVIGEAIIGALAFVRAGTQVAPRSMWVGAPARCFRAVSAREIEWKSRGTREYHALAERSLVTMHAVEPLIAEQPDRPRLGGTYAPLDEMPSSGDAPSFASPQSRRDHD